MRVKLKLTLKVDDVRPTTRFQDVEEIDIYISHDIDGETWCELFKSAADSAARTMRARYLMQVNK